MPHRHMELFNFLIVKIHTLYLLINKIHYAPSWIYFKLSHQLDSTVGFFFYDRLRLLIGPSTHMLRANSSKTAHDTCHFNKIIHQTASTG